MPLGIHSAIFHVRWKAWGNISYTELFLGQFPKIRPVFRIMVLYIQTNTSTIMLICIDAWRNVLRECLCKYFREDVLREPIIDVKLFSEDGEDVLFSY